MADEFFLIFPSYFLQSGPFCSHCLFCLQTDKKAQETMVACFFLIAVLSLAEIKGGVTWAVWRDRQ